MEHCFLTIWARFKVYPTKIPPFEREFHAEFENEGPGASFFDFDVVFSYVHKKKSLEQCFVTTWARFRFYPVKIPPLEPQFHAEFENEGPRASFFDFDIILHYFLYKKQVGTLFFHQLGTV